jgi:hypothetical protein
MIKKLSTEIIDIKRSEGEGNQWQRTYKLFFNRNPPFKAIETPSAKLNIDLGNVKCDSFCTYHQEKYSKRDSPKWVHAMNLMSNRFLDEISLTEQSSGSMVNISDQEEVDPPVETTMLLWDPYLPMPSDDIFYVQEPPVEVLDVHNWSKGQPVSNDLTIAQTSRGKKTIDCSKAPFVSQRNPINIHRRESSKLDYNIVEVLKILKANMSVMDMCRIPPKKDFLLQDLSQ